MKQPYFTLKEQNLNYIDAKFFFKEVKNWCCSEQKVKPFQYYQTDPERPQMNLRQFAEVKSPTSLTQVNSCK